MKNIKKLFLATILITSLSNFNSQAMKNPTQGDIPLIQWPPNWKTTAYVAPDNDLREFTQGEEPINATQNISKEEIKGKIKKIFEKYQKFTLLLIDSNNTNKEIIEQYVSDLTDKIAKLLPELPQNDSSLNILQNMLIKIWNKIKSEKSFALIEEHNGHRYLFSNNNFPVIWELGNQDLHNPKLFNNPDTKKTESEDTNSKKK